MRQNEAGRHLLLSVLSEDDRRYFIFIPEGFDLLGWEFMRCKLKELAKIGEVSSVEQRSHVPWEEGMDFLLLDPT